MECRQCREKDAHIQSLNQDIITKIEKSLAKNEEIGDLIDENYALKQEISNLKAQIVSHTREVRRPSEKYIDRT